MDKSTSYLKSIIRNDDTLVVGVSGGPDSMCLLSLLVDLRKDINFKIVVCHVNHKVREEADEEALFVKEYCSKNNIVFELLELDKLTGNFEFEARKKRYAFYENIINKYNAKYLLTAHHGDDLVETIMMRLLRGASFSAYKGISLETKRDKYIILRPLLFYTKDEIVSYLDSNNIEYKIDYTNYLDVHTRNRVRKNILPYLKEENENVHMKFLDFSNQVNDIDNYLQNITNNILKKIYINNVLDINEFKKQDKLIQRRLIEEILHQKYKDDLYLVTNSNTEEIIKIINSSKPNVKVELPLGYIVLKKYDKLQLCDSKEKYSFDKKELSGDLSYQYGDIVFLNETDEKSNFVLKLDSNEVALPLYVRTRLDGDSIAVKNLGGKKKVNDILIDMKIPIEDRDKILLVLDSNDNILWIPGIKKSKFDKEFNEKYDIILKYIKKGD